MPVHMYARLIPVQFRAIFVEDFLSVYRKTAVPDLLQRRGFGGGLVLVDAEKNTGLVVSLWDSQEALTRSKSHSQRILSAMLLPFLAEPPMMETYEVYVQAGQYIGGKFARTLTLPVANARLDEALAIYTDALLPQLKRLAGFQGVLWLADREAGSGLGLTLWTSAEAMRAADEEDGFFPTAAAKLVPFFHAVPVRNYYAVSLQL